MIGQGVAEYNEPLFRRCARKAPTSARSIRKMAWRSLLDAVAARQKSHPEPYAHWYIDGGEAAAHDPGSDRRLVSRAGAGTIRAARQNAGRSRSAPATVPKICAPSWRRFVPQMSVSIPEMPS